MAPRLMLVPLFRPKLVLGARGKTKALWRGGMALCAVLALVSCAPPQTRPLAATPEPAPVERVARVAPVPVIVAPSQASRALAERYARLEERLLVRGLLRSDGGGIDARFNAEQLAQNFERIAFFTESRPGTGFRADRSEIGLTRWSAPVRVQVVFGPQVPQATRDRDTERVRAYTARLARASGHPIQMAAEGANFHVIFAGEDDRAALVPRIRSLVPELQESILAQIANLPETVMCFVITVPAAGNPHEIRRALALIRSEHPTRLRQACIHEELAQGLGLQNDDPRVRPSIFNDDDEFALLTTHDELLLRMLYDPRLRLGQSAASARPLVRQIARELVPQVGL